jgi:hypothetical protein
LEEDLRMLAQSKLGQAILDEEDAPLRQITVQEELMLRQLIKRVQDGKLPKP